MTWHMFFAQLGVPLCSSCSVLELDRVLYPLVRVLTMVISQRISAIEDLVLNTHLVVFTCSFSPVSGKVVAKVKVSATPNVIPLEARHLLLAALAPLHVMTSSSTTVD